MRIKKDFSYDSKLLIAIGIAVVFGLFMIASASAVYATTRFDDQYFFLKRQLLAGVLPGGLAFLFFMRVDYHYWKKWSIVGFIVSLIALGLVFIPGLGTSAYGATRWLNLGPISFQPSEMAKLAVIVYLAA